MLQFLSTRIEEILNLGRNTFIPAFVFAISILSFYGNGELSASSNLYLHYTFLTLILSTGLILLYFNRSNGIFFSTIILISYISLNYIKRKLGADFASGNFFQNLSFLTPLNLLFFYFVPKGSLLTKYNIYYLLGLFLEFTLLEKLTSHSISLGLYFPILNSTTISSISISLFILLCIICFINSSINGHILNSSMFFACLEVYLGFIYSSNPSGLTIFFTAAALSVFYGTIREIYYTTYTDIQTQLPSRNSYLIDCKKFPLKYSLGLICLDDYDKLRKAFGKRGVNKLLKMIGICIEHTNLDVESSLYRYNEDEFIIIFKNEDKKSSFNYLEQIRRNIAASEFIINSHTRALKLTVSCCISEKKRSDANSFEVLSRAGKALDKTRQFSNNVTSKA